MPKETDPKIVALIVQMHDAGIPPAKIAEAVEMTANGIRYILERHQYRHAIQYRDDSRDFNHQPTHETEIQAKLFAKAMNGQRYESIRIKSYGRAVPPHPSHVMTQSSAGSCADAA